MDRRRCPCVWHSVVVVVVVECGNSIGKVGPNLVDSSKNHRVDGWETTTMVVATDPDH